MLVVTDKTKTRGQGGASNAQIDKWRYVRWQGRTDLFYLAHNILGYNSTNYSFGLSKPVHQYLINHLQQFPMPDRETAERLDLVRPTAAGGCIYPVGGKPAMTRKQLPGKRRRLILAPRSYFKCLCPDEEVLTHTGVYKRIKDLEPGVDRVYSMTDDYRLEWADIQAKQEQPAQSCFEIKFRSGRVVRSSGNHPFRLIDGWVEAEQLRPGDRIAITGKVELPESGPDLPYAEILGWMLGDGSFPTGTVTNVNPRFRKLIIAAAQKAGGTAHEMDGKERASYVRIQGLRDLWRGFGLLECRAGSKHIPEVVFSASNDSVAGVLRTLFASDGTCNHSSIALSTKSERLARQVQRLLLRFDIDSTLFSFEQKPYGIHWRVIISSEPQVTRFFDRIGWIKHYKYQFSGRTRSNWNTVPREWKKTKYLFARGTRPAHLPEFSTGDTSKTKLEKWAEALNNPILKQLSSDDIYWDSVLSVTPIGEMPTWDIQTSTGNFAVSDLVSHNTTINCIAHSIQWLLNYPDMSLLMVQSSTEKAERNLLEMKSHFLHNSLFREVYPEYCPANTKKDWGNRTEFTLPNRTNKNRKEPSCLTASIDKKTAGLHVEVIKCSDIVEEANTRTASMMEDIAYRFEMFKKLLVDPDDFIDLEGTRYDYSDLYGKIIDADKPRPPEKRQWSFYIQSIYKKDTGGAPPTFQPEEMDLPYLRDANGDFVSWWPERFTVEMLESERYALPESEEVFATQMLNNPLDVKGKQVFDKGEIAWIDREDFDKAKIVFRTVTVDTAETQSERSDFTAITTAAWDRAGKCYIEDIRFGRMKEDEIIQNLFAVWVKFHPVSIKIEETGFVRGLKSSVSRMSEKLNIFPVFEFIPRDTHTSKQERIRGIQPWFKSGDLRFLTDLKYRAELVDQLCKFPKYRYDDILDTIADQFQNREHFGRLSRRQTPEEVFKVARKNLFEGILDEPEKYDEVRLLTGF